MRRTVCIFMVASIAINQFFTIGFFASINKNEFKAAAFLNAVVMFIAAYMIFSKKPWKPDIKISNPRFSELQRIGTRRVWNDLKERVETVEDLPIIDEEEADFATDQMSRSIIPVVNL